MEGYYECNSIIYCRNESTPLMKRRCHFCFSSNSCPVVFCRDSPQSYLLVNFLTSLPCVVSVCNIDYEDGDGIAKLIIPEVNIAYDVFWGTGDEALAKGVGMYESEWTTPPDHGRHTVLSGHRDSVFSPIGELEEGDSLYINYNNEDYEYQIDKIWITDEDDRSVIVEKDEPTLTLSTCYPFQFIGSAPDRYIVQAELVRKGDLLDLNES